MNGCRLYFGSVMHRRLGSVRHRFRYRVFSILVDLDKLAELGRSTRLFSYNRWNIVAFYDRDHGPGDGSPLKLWIERHLSAAGLGHVLGGRIRLLCFPRLWGYVFNPLSVYFCEAPDGRLAAILYEVNNTFGERHCYLEPVHSTPEGIAEHSTEKRFYVSPFILIDANYRFRVQLSDDQLSLAVRQASPDGQRLHAVLSGQAGPFDDWTMLRAIVSYPLMTFKVIAAIHWEALRLWRKGAPYRPRPPTPVTGVTYGSGCH